MHDGALVVDESLARTLLAESFPGLGAAELRVLSTTGTVNTIVRVGEELVARFPLLPATGAELRAEAAAMTALAEICPFETPVPRGISAGTVDFPSSWSLQTWVPGRTAGFDADAESASLAQDLVTLIQSLRAADTDGRTFDGRGRGGNLLEHDEWVAQCLRESGHLLDVPRAERLWSALRALPPVGPDVMSHRDLTPFNLLVEDRSGDTRLSGVLDAGGFGPADRSLDLVCAWHLFDASGRRGLRDGLDVSDVEWLRGAAWAFQQAMGLGWYYEESLPEMSALGRSTLRRLLEDEELSALIG